MQNNLNIYSLEKFRSNLLLSSALFPIRAPIKFHIILLGLSNHQKIVGFGGISLLEFLLKFLCSHHKIYETSLTYCSSLQEWPQLSVYTPFAIWFCLPSGGTVYFPHSEFWTGLVTWFGQQNRVEVMVSRADFKNIGTLPLIFIESLTALGWSICSHPGWGKATRSRTSHPSPGNCRVAIVTK